MDWGKKKEKNKDRRRKRTRRGEYTENKKNRQKERREDEEEKHRGQTRNRDQRRKAVGARTRESLGPANPQHQDPYHHSLRPEQGNSKAQTKSFLPEHNLKRKKRKTERKASRGEENRGRQGIKENWQTNHTSSKIKRKPENKKEKTRRRESKKRLINQQPHAFALGYQVSSSSSLLCKFISFVTVQR